MAVIVGLTGGIASGKSTVSRMLREHGALIIDADVLAREVVAPGMPACREIGALLGNTILRSDGSLDRKAVARMVFADAELRRKLEEIIHPRVARRMREETKDCLHQFPKGVIVQDVPLLLETGMDQAVQEVLVVYVPWRTQLQRLMDRDGLSESQAMARIDAQMPIEEKRKLATIVINNSGSLEQTRAQVVAVYAQLARNASMDRVVQA
jgi:dephospho-CoA kinase